MGDEIRFGNYSSCCRLCLSEQFDSLKPIFEGADNEDGTVLVQQILTFLGIEIAQADKLSTMICDACRQKIIGFEEYKKSCSENQRKLQHWLSTWVPNSENTELVIIKSEPPEIDEEYYDEPPVLSPHRPLGEDLQVSTTEINEPALNGYAFQKPPILPKVVLTKSNKTCTYCDKTFATSGNRLRHERTFHRIENITNVSVLTNQEEEASQHSIESEISRNGSIPPSLDSEADLSESDVQKIQFAAGLRLKSKTNNPDDGKTDQSSITKIEEAYVEKNKAVVSMLHSSYCACHNLYYNTAKRLFGHLRANYNWFPIFTCYNCLITFKSRAGLMKHCGKCPKPFLENCIRLAQIKKRSDNRCRLYQHYKCGTCEIQFAFYDDYREHLELEEEQHVGDVCKSCLKVFIDKDDAKKHLYDDSCNLHYFCDICYTSFEKLDKFKEHCEEGHDKYDNYIFVEYHKEFKHVDSLEILRSRKRKYSEIETENNQDDSVIINSKQAKRLKMIKMEKLLSKRIDDNIENIEDNLEINEDSLEIISSNKPDDDESENDNENVNNTNTSYNLRSPMARSPRKYGKYKFNGWKNEPTKCLKCEREFSTYYNMVRHMKTHEESEKHLQCSFCTEKFRLISELKDHLNVTHGEAHICPDCGKQFETFKQLEQHRIVHLNIKVYRDSETSSYRVTNPRYQCEECDAAFDTENLLKQHLTKHVVVKKERDINNDDLETLKRTKYSCNECDRHYLSAKGLYLHNKRHHPNRKLPQQSYKCDLCDKVCSTNAAYHAHRTMHFRNSNLTKAKNEKDSIRKSVNDEQNDEDDDYFTCKRCFKVFSTKYNLKTHLKTHGVTVAGGRSVSKSGKSTKTFWCDICHQACQGYQELQKHKQEHVNENLGETESVEDDVIDIKPNLKTCDLCSRIFITHLGYVKHRQRHERKHNLKVVSVKKGTNFYFCKYCKIPFSSTNALCDHMLREHDEIIKQEKPKQQQQQEEDESKKFCCNLCNKSFVSSGALCSHQGWHKRTNNMKSALNYVTKPQPGNSYENNGSHYSKQTNQITTYKLKKEIKQEPLQQASTSFKARNTCKTCGLSFSTDTALQLHILEVHRNVNATLITPKCVTCQIEFATNEAYDEHQKLHSLPAHMLFKCKHCTKTFPKCNVYNMHINTVHPECNPDGRIKCHVCNRFFEKQNALAMHLKVHDRQKMSVPFTLKQEANPKPPVLKKMYTCSICFASFPVAKDLRDHIISTHPF